MNSNPRRNFPKRRAAVAGVLVSVAAAASVYAHGAINEPATVTEQAVRIGERMPSPVPTVAPTTTTPRPAPTPPSIPPTTGFPTRASAGVPAGWSPKSSVSGDYRVTTAGAVIEDLRITNGIIIVDAPNVTIRRVEILGGGINNFAGSICRNGLVIEDTTISRTNGQTTDGDWPAVGTGGYTARNVKIDGLPEGFRAGGVDDGCGPVVIEDSYARIVSPDTCTGDEWHGDALQGYDGPALTMTNSVLVLVEVNGCGGTAPFFYPRGQGNTSVDIDGLIVSGGGYPFRNGAPGTVRNLKIVNNSWVYGPIDVYCSALTAWSAEIVNLNPAGQLTRVRDQPCNTDTGN